MPETIEVSFPGGQRVDAKIREFVIQTDQSKEHGGDQSAAQPYDLFLSSIATCAGIFALKFCQSRNIPTDGLRLRMDWEWNPSDPTASRAVLGLTLPPGFPERYEASILKAMDLCAVKRTIETPPHFESHILRDDKGVD
ncbi:MULTISPECIES: OsmC family protein [Thiorhodococcus]|uniref:OsmC family protein n=2 Tax=Thiorhodococcus TaxID=57488 RepID=G2E7U6_9GAMM|nr:OsmC family protein [Thiorhodococcus drewsii]EGV27821.1 OsmC family protein [Thiorhodococcus drewsii AZ1]